MGLRYKGKTKTISKFTVLVSSVIVLSSPIIAAPLVFASPHMTNYPIGCSLPTGATPNDITTGPDGAMWFTLNVGSDSYIGRMTTSGSMTCYLATSSNYDDPIGIICRAGWRSMVCP